MSNTKQDRIFLCHASEDKKQVLGFYNQLKAAGFNPWLDKKDLLPGQQWNREIKRALKSSRFIIIFFSRHSVSKRGYVQREFKLALDTLAEIPEGQIFIIPVRLDECRVPEAFGHIHHVDLFAEEGFDLLMAAISTQAKQSESSNLFTDPRDGQTYKTVELLGKTWLAENLNYDLGVDCWFYDNDPKNGKKYGRLYTWEAAQKACPPGWRLPSDEGISALIGYYGSEEAAYQGLIDGGASGFNALLGGNRGTGGSFLFLGAFGIYWSATERDGGYAYHYSFDGEDQGLYRYYNDQGFGFSVRCLQN